MRIHTKAVVAAIVVSLSLTGCGGSGDDQKAADNIAKELTTNDSQMKLTKDEAQCIGDGMVDKVGVDKLKKYKLLNDDLTTTGTSSSEFKLPEDDAEATADVFVGCADLKGMMMEQMGTADVSDEMKTCIDDALDDDTMKTFLAAMFQGDDAAGEKAMAPVMECATGA